MESDISEKIKEAICRIARLDEENLHIIAEDTIVHVHVSGALPGDSVVYAYKRRARIARIVKKELEGTNLDYRVTFDVDDSLHKVKKISTSIILGLASPETEFLEVRFKRPRTLVFVFSKLARSDRDAIVKSLQPLLNRKNLSLEIDQLDMAIAVYGLLSSTRLLGIIKTNAPCNIETLHDRNGTSDATNEIKKRLNHELDRLRLNRLITRSSQGFYNLTPQGLTVLGGHKRRNSSDVARALALGTRYR